jgi:hypothetical protein
LKWRAKHIETMQNKKLLPTDEFEETRTNKIHQKIDFCMFGFSRVWRVFAEKIFLTDFFEKIQALPDYIWQSNAFFQTLCFTLKYLASIVFVVVVVSTSFFLGQNKKIRVVWYWMMNQIAKFQEIRWTLVPFI